MEIAFTAVPTGQTRSAINGILIVDSTVTIVAVSTTPHVQAGRVPTIGNARHFGEIHNVQPVRGEVLGSVLEDLGRRLLIPEIVSRWVPRIPGQHQVTRTLQTGTGRRRRDRARRADRTGRRHTGTG